MIKNRSSYIELDKSALAHNVRSIRELIQDEVLLSSVVKANAYGHGIREMIPLLEEIGQHHFSVFSAYEARLVQQVMNEAGAIMIMGDIPKEDREWVVLKGIEFFTSSTPHLEVMLLEARRLHKKIKIHLELETGMHRHGVEEDELPGFLNLLKKNEQFVEIKGVCTHFAGSENEANNTRIHRQQQAFLRGVKNIKRAGFNPEYRHVSCSAAALNYPDWNLDLVRVGILQYGLWPSQESRVRYQRKLKLRPILSWKTQIMGIKTVPAEEYVGYGTSFLAEKEMKIASFPIGYGYGYTRVLSNRGTVLINGKHAPVVGTINMNMTLVDCTGIDVEMGDTVTLIGGEGDQAIYPRYFGNDSSPLNYEVLARLDKSIPRLVS